MYGVPFCGWLNKFCCHFPLVPSIYFCVIRLHFSDNLIHISLPQHLCGCPPLFPLRPFYYYILLLLSWLLCPLLMSLDILKILSLDIPCLLAASLGMVILMNWWFIVLLCYCNRLLVPWVLFFPPVFSRSFLAPVRCLCCCELHEGPDMHPGSFLLGIGHIGCNRILKGIQKNSNPFTADRFHTNSSTNSTQTRVWSPFLIVCVEIAITISIFNISPILNIQLHPCGSCECKYPIKNPIPDIFMAYKSLWLYF